MRKEYEITQEQRDKITEAGKAVRLVMPNGGILYRTAQGNANMAWERLGQEMGFDWRTVKPMSATSTTRFTAEQTVKLFQNT